MSAAFHSHRRVGETCDKPNWPTLCDRELLAAPLKHHENPEESPNLVRACNTPELTQGGRMSSPGPRVLPKVERSGNITIITFTPDAIRDVENVIARELKGLALGTEKQHVLLDFTNVDQLNSFELGTLVTLHKQVEQTGGRLTLFNVRAEVFEIFTITRLDTLLGICREGVVVKSNLFPAHGAEALDPATT